MTTSRCERCGTECPSDEKVWWEHPPRFGTPFYVDGSAGMSVCVECDELLLELAREEQDAED